MIEYALSFSFASATSTQKPRGLQTITDKTNLDFVSIRKLFSNFFNKVVYCVNHLEKILT